MIWKKLISISRNNYSNSRDRRPVSPIAMVVCSSWLVVQTIQWYWMVRDFWLLGLWHPGVAQTHIQYNDIVHSSTLWTVVYLEKFANHLMGVRSNGMPVALQELFAHSPSKLTCSTQNQHLPGCHDATAKPSSHRSYVGIGWNWFLMQNVAVILHPKCGAFMHFPHLDLMSRLP